LRHLFGFLLLLNAIGYAQNTYDINVKWIDVNAPLSITQNIHWTNNSDVSVKDVYLLDWNHAYSSARSQLGYFLANEFDYKLIRASKKNQGYTDIKEIHHGGQTLKWEREPEKREAIKISFDDAIAPKSSIDFTVVYTVKLPDAAKFKYGISKDQLFTYHWHLVLGTLNSDGSWLANTNFGFGKPMSPTAEVRYQLDTNQDFELLLPAQNTTEVSPLLLTRREAFQTVSFGNATLITDMIPVDETIGLTSHLKNIEVFLMRNFKDVDAQTIWAFEEDYKSYSLLALESIPSFLKAFDKAQVVELKLLKSLLHWYITQKYGQTDKQSDWILDGMPNFLWNQYVQEHYPNLLMTGALGNLPFVKNYHFAQAPYHRSWELSTNVSTNKNRGQALTTSKRSLTRYNRRIANPSRAALALMYLDHYIGDDILTNTLKNIPKSSLSNAVLKKQLQQKTDKPLDWFFDHYIHLDNNVDVVLQGKKLNAEISRIQISSTQPEIAIPIKKILTNGTQQTDWILSQDLPFEQDYKNAEVATLTINENHYIPEQQLNNNTYRLGNKLFRNNLKFRFLQDISKSGTALLLYRPEFAYNFYDGLLGGISIANSSILANKYRFKFSPQYGVKRQQISGLGLVIADFYKENSSHYLTRINLFGSSYHYAPQLRYTVFTPSLIFYYRPKGIQNKERSSLQIRHVSVRLDDLPAEDERRGYGVSLASFQSRKGTALDNFSYKIEAQMARKFKKLSLDAEYITYYAPNRRWTMRLFAGTFLSNSANDSYYDFNVSRVNDYLFQYDLYGRSEAEGFFSQQYIKAEGALRTTGNLTSANQWLMTAQSATTIWRWVEGYAEIGWVKSKFQTPETHWGTGITFNLVPDFFELHFPIYNSNGPVYANNAYLKHIRFQLSLRPASLAKLFSRSWF
jgi:hypothetical protein